LYAYKLWINVRGKIIEERAKMGTMNHKISKQDYKQ